MGTIFYSCEQAVYHHTNEWMKIKTTSNIDLDHSRNYNFSNDNYDAHFLQNIKNWIAQSTTKFGICLTSARG